jgi:hypothetical protein
MSSSSVAFIVLGLLVALLCYASFYATVVQSAENSFDTWQEHPWPHERIPDDIMTKFNIPAQSSYIHVETICDKQVILLSNAPVDGHELYIRLSDKELVLRCPRGRIPPSDPNCYDTEEKICGLSAQYTLKA